MANQYGSNLYGRTAAQTAEAWQPVMNTIAGGFGDPAYKARVTTPGATGYNEAATWLYQNPGKTMADYFGSGPGAQYARPVPSGGGQGAPGMFIQGGGVNPEVEGKYFGETGGIYDPARDQKSYWYNPTDKTWYGGNRSGAIENVGQNPWAKSVAMEGNNPGGGGDRGKGGPPPKETTQYKQLASTGDEDTNGNGGGGGAGGGAGGESGGTPPAGAVNYYNAQGGTYGNEDESYWYNQADKVWYKGDKSGKITSIGANPPWQKKSPGGQMNLEDILAKYGINLDSARGKYGGSGLLTLASLLGGSRPKSWLTPGVGYGDIPGKKVTYFNEAGRPFKSGQDTSSYWYNQPDRAWYSGNLKGEITKPGTLPWAGGQKYESPNPADNNSVNYFNSQGQPWKPGDPKSYWFNRADQVWYEGMEDGSIKRVTKLPWQ